MSKLKIDFDNPPMAPADFTYKPEELKGRCDKIGGEWYCVSVVYREETMTVCSLSRGKKMKPTLRECMTKAIEASECSK
jgi:hypothetical protein